MATKYAPLAAWLDRQAESSIRLTFAEVERILGFTLPDSARRYQAWWANGAAQPMPQQYAWLEQGWETFGLDLNAATIGFRRAGSTTLRRRGRPSGGRVDVVLDEDDDLPIPGPIPVLELLGQLGSVRPVFHSEADFQHALAWQIHAHWPQARVRLETRPRPRAHLDLLAVVDGVRVAIELKYLTARWTGDIEGEHFELIGQSAHDIARYDVIKDLVRVESFVADGYADIGWGITLTNDSAYLRPGTKAQPIDAAFRLHQGRMLEGTLRWSAQAGAGTTKGRDAPHVLHGRYECRWREYSALPAGDGAYRFWHLAVPIGPAG